MDSDEALSTLGHNGLFQLGIYFIMGFITAIPSAWHMLSIVFIGQEPNYHCAINETNLLNETIPFDNNLGVFDKCHIFKNYTFKSNETTQCPNDKFWFDNETNSIVNEFNLTCGRSYLTDLTQTILVLGVFIGAIFCTNLSDRYGRKPIVFGTIFSVSIFGTIASQMPNYWSLTFIRFFIGISQQGLSLSGFVYLCEIFPASKRTMPGMLVAIIWAIGMASLAPIAYFVRYWRHLMLILSVPLLASLPFYFVLPESLPWLIAKGKYDLAKNYIINAAQFNKIPFNKIEKYIYFNPMKNNNDLLSHEPKDYINMLASYSLLDLLKVKRLRLYCIILSYLFCTNTLVYYGLSLSTGSLVGNSYLNFLFSSLVEIPAYIVTAFSLKYFGRRWPICIFHIIAGISLLATGCIPKKINNFDMSYFITSFSMIGKFAITASFGAIFLWAPEMLPTTVRIQGFGMVTLVGRLGNFIAPFTSYISKKVYWLPGLVFGVMSFVGAIFSLLLPETLNRPLPQTIEEIEKWTLSVSTENKKKMKILQEHKENSQDDSL